MKPWARFRSQARIAIDESLIAESFIQASGPGGQNVNKVASAVQLRFDAKNAGLPFVVHARLEVLAGSRLTKDGEIVITARQFRDQQRNRDDARARPDRADPRGGDHPQEAPAHPPHQGTARSGGWRARRCAPASRDARHRGSRIELLLRSHRVRDARCERSKPPWNTTPCS